MGGWRFSKVGHLIELADHRRPYTVVVSDRSRGPFKFTSPKLDVFPARSAGSRELTVFWKPRPGPTRPDLEPSVLEVPFCLLKIRPPEKFQGRFFGVKKSSSFARALGCAYYRAPAVFICIYKIG